MDTAPKSTILKSFWQTARYAAFIGNDDGIPFLMKAAYFAVCRKLFKIVDLGAVHVKNCVFYIHLAKQLCLAT